MVLHHLQRAARRGLTVLAVGLACATMAVGPASATEPFHPLNLGEGFDDQTLGDELFTYSSYHAADEWLIDEATNDWLYDALTAKNAAYASLQSAQNMLAYYVGEEDAPNIAYWSGQVTEREETYWGAYDAWDQVQASVDAADYVMYLEGDDLIYHSSNLVDQVIANHQPAHLEECPGLVRAYAVEFFLEGTAVTAAYLWNNGPHGCYGG